MMTQSSPATTTGDYHSIGSFLRRSLWTIGGAVRQLFSSPQSAVGTIIVFVFLILALFGPMLAPYTENDQKQPVAAAPSTAYPFGTDHLGRDVFSRVILGASSIVWKAGLGTLVAVVFGAALGLWIGFAGGLLEEVISRFIDAFLATPALLVALVILGIVRAMDIPPGSFGVWISDRAVLLVIALIYIPIVARVVRSATLDVRTREFIQAARIRGESTAYIIFREILPSVIPALVVESSLRFSYAIFLVASLGFLGVGARPPSADWGLMVNENRGGLYALTPWALTYPAGAIAILVVGVNLMSDAIKNLVQKGTR